MQHLSFNHLGYTLHGHPITPVISNTSAEMQLHRINLSPRSSLHLKGQKIDESAPICWMLNLDFPSLSPSLSPIHFEIHRRAITIFSQELLEHHEEQTAAIALDLTPLDHFLNHPTPARERFKQLAHYLLDLTSQLPGSLPLFLMFGQTASLSPAQLLNLLATEIFFPLLPVAQIKHPRYLFELGIVHPLENGWQIKSFHASDRALLIPLQSYCTPNVSIVLDRFLSQPKNRPFPDRLISESRLTDEWDSLSTLYLYSQALSPQGKRKVEGFVAAGGTLVELTV